jgi:hypothetical protein
MFLCDFLKSVKPTQHELYMLYCDPYTRFDDPTFDDFNAIQALINDALPMNWFFGVSKLQLIMREFFKLVVDKMKQ